MNKIIVGVLVVLTLAVGYVMFNSSLLGKGSGPSHFQHESFLQGLSAGGRDQFTIDNAGGVTIGTSGGELNFYKRSTCSLIASSFTVAASTTVSMDCAVTGVVSGDVVDAWFATSTVSGNGWSITGSSASTTSGYITLRVTNWTGASGVIPASLASTTKYEVSR